jgi:tetratricopeptide (TPR) repeat protein
VSKEIKTFGKFLLYSSSFFIVSAVFFLVLYYAESFYIKIVAAIGFLGTCITIYAFFHKAPVKLEEEVENNINKTEKNTKNILDVANNEVKKSGQRHEELRKDHENLPKQLVDELEKRGILPLPDKKEVKKELSEIKKEINQCATELIDEAENEYDKGTNYYNQFKFNQAEKHYQRAIEKINAPSFYFALGNTQFGLSKYECALQSYNTTLSLARDKQKKIVEGNVLNNIGAIYEVWGKYDQAINCFNESLKICKEIGNRKGEGVALNNIGKIYYLQDEKDLAVKYYNDSLLIRCEINDHYGTGLVLNNIGAILEARGQIDKAIKAFKKSLKICKKIGDEEGAGFALNNIGKIYYEQGEYDQAIKYYNDSLKIFRKAENLKEECAVMNNIGTVYNALGKYDQAMDYYKKSLERKEIGDLAGEAATKYNIVGIYEKQGKLKEAIVLMERVVEIEKQTNNPHYEEDLKHLNQLKQIL